LAKAGVKTGFEKGGMEYRGILRGAAAAAGQNDKKKPLQKQLQRLFIYRNGF
jgi:hypothetical protein